MPFPITIRRDCSVSDLVAVHRSGGSVVKSPHVGNVYPNNLAIAAAGIRMNFYDRTLGVRDTNFYPHRVICGGQSETIASANVLTTHAIVESIPTRAATWFAKGERTVTCHMRALAAALPHADCIVYTDWLAEHAERVMTVLELATDAMPRIWERMVHADGTIGRAYVRNWASAVAQGVFGLTNGQRSGLLIPNVLNVLLDGVLECALREVREVYHCSGPDMVQYVNGMQRTLHDLYDAVRPHLGWRLPETIRFNVVPVADVRFAVPMRRRAALDELIGAWQALGSLKRTHAARMRPSMESAELSRAIAACSEERSAATVHLRDAVVACPDVFYRIQDANCFTQYDLLAEQAALYVHPWALEASVEDVQCAMRVFSRLRDARNGSS